MKKVLFVLFLVAMSTKAFSAAYVVDFFDRGAFKAMDGNSALVNDELIAHSSTTATSTNYNWAPTMRRPRLLPLKARSAQ